MVVVLVTVRTGPALLVIIYPVIGIPPVYNGGDQDNDMPPFVSIIDKARGSEG